jgi:hypothetical protein
MLENRKIIGHERRLRPDDAEVMRTRYSIVEGGINNTIHSLQRSRPVLESQVVEELIRQAEEEAAQSMAAVTPEQTPADAAIFEKVAKKAGSIVPQSDMLDLHAQDQALDTDKFADMTAGTTAQEMPLMESQGDYELAQ